MPNTTLVIALVFLILGTGMGAMLSALFRYVKRYGAALIVTVNPNTKEIDLLYRKPQGEDFFKLLGSDVPLEGDFRHHNGTRPAFLVDTANGLPLKVMGNELIRLNGQRLREIRKGIKIKRIAEAGGTDLAALAKYALVGIGILCLMMMGALFLLTKVAGATGAA